MCKHALLPGRTRQLWLKERRFLPAPVRVHVQHLHDEGGRVPCLQQSHALRSTASTESKQALTASSTQQLHGILLTAMLLCRGGNWNTAKSWSRYSTGNFANRGKKAARPSTPTTLSGPPSDPGATAANLSRYATVTDHHVCGKKARDRACQMCTASCSTGRQRAQTPVQWPSAVDSTEEAGPSRHRLSSNREALTSAHDRACLASLTGHAWHWNGMPLGRTQGRA